MGHRLPLRRCAEGDRRRCGRFRNFADARGTCRLVPSGRGISRWPFGQLGRHPDLRVYRGEIRNIRRRLSGGNLCGKLPRAEGPLLEGWGDSGRRKSSRGASRVRPGRDLRGDGRVHRCPVERPTSPAIRPRCFAVGGDMFRMCPK